MHFRTFCLGILCICFTLVCACGGGSSGSSGSNGVDTVVEEIPDILTPPERSLASTGPVVLMKATPDECYAKVTIDWSNYPDYSFVRNSNTPPDPPYAGCADGEIPKYNEAYVWGLALAGDRLWLGTGANVQCLVEGAYLGILWPHEFKDETGAVTQTCEFAASWILDPQYDGSAPDLPPELGDWRPPSIHYYDLSNAQQEYDIQDREIDPTGLNRLNKTLGLRSAGAIGDVVFLAGPDFGSQDGSKNVNVFAFKSSTADYLGSYVLANYSNIRKWKAINGHLYAVLAVAADIVDDGNYGHVLKWVGTPDNPFEGPDGSAPFAVVGRLPGGGAELCEYGNDRMAVATWPGGIDEAGVTSDLNLTALKHGGIYISVPMPADGLNPAGAATNFKEAFTYDQYDPDMVRAYTYGGGALAYFDGWLIWGSMHVPYTNQQAMNIAYRALFDIPRTTSYCRNILDPDDTCENLEGETEDYALREQCLAELYAAAPPEIQEEYDACVEMKANYNIARQDPAISIFRGRNLETDDPEIDVLYGYESMMSLNIRLLTQLKIARGETPGTWWEEGVRWQEKLNLIGPPVFGEAGFGNPNNNYTWEMRIVNDRLYVGTMDKGTVTGDILSDDAGADLYSFTSAHQAAVEEDRNGLQNKCNYGFRTMLPGPPDKLYIGTANPFNLMPEGGWELLEVAVQ